MRGQNKKQRIGFCFSIILLIILASLNLQAQSRDELQESLFGETDKLFIQAKSEQANILSPTNFKNATNKYNQALREFDKGKGLKNIQQKLVEVRKSLDKAIETAKLGKITFATTLKAREDALNANATEYAPNAYEEAENEFISATKKLERGDIKNAKKKVPEIDGRYRKAELLAIKASIIGTVRNLMKEAKKVEAHKYAPITYANAQKLLNEAEAILNSSRRSETNAREKAEAAEIEAKHAIFLTREIKRLKDNENEWENFILDREIIIEDIAKELGFTATFEEGLDKPLKSIYAITQNLQKEKKDLLREVEEKNTQIQQLKEELQKYREKEQGLQAELQEKRMKLEMKKRREEEIRSLEQMFRPNEAIVLRKGNDIILRLIGLTFPSGKSVIEPEYFSLLATVQRAIRKFPNAALTIEGHTDSIGDDRYNENLSYERAMAVKKYLLANMGLEESRITAVGYGETRPVASNETREGRAQNRRIDVVLTFAEEVSSLL
jgi:outer membrane protein OmpA-like peptidoglycan-associated protein